MPQVQPELTFRALSLLLIVFLGVILVVFSLLSMWKENRFGWPLRGIIWFTVAIVGSCAVIVDTSRNSDALIQNPDYSYEDRRRAQAIFTEEIEGSS